MKLSVAIFFGGLFGALGILFFLVAFGTDYWLLATELGRCSDGLNDTRVSILIFSQHALKYKKISHGWGLFSIV